VMGRSCDSPDLFVDLKGATKNEDGTYSGSPVVPLLNVHILKLEGPVFFANIARLVEVLQRIHARAPKQVPETLLPEGYLPPASLLDSSQTTQPSHFQSQNSPRVPRLMPHDEVRTDDSLFFGVLPEEECSISSIILDLSCVTRLDATALWYLSASIHDCHRLGQRMLLVHSNDDAMLLTLSRAGLVKLCGEHSIHSSIAAAARALNAPVQVYSPPPAGQMNLRKKILGVWRLVFG